MGEGNSLGFVMLFEVLVQHPNQDVQSSWMSEYKTKESGEG